MPVYTYSQHTRTRRSATPQTEKLFGTNQVENSAGGYSFPVDNFKKLDRFLILGSEGGSYYAGERELTRENATSIIEAIKEDGVRVVNRIVEISHAGRAPKNDPALFALALVTTYGNDEAKAAAYAALPAVARIGTHVLHFAEYVNAMRGWGRGLRTALGNWYNSQNPKGLAINLVKYANRDGWTHRDILRLAHVKPSTPEHQQLLRLAVGKDFNFSEAPESGKFIQAVQTIKQVDSPIIAAALISAERLPREVVPTELLKHSEVWEALLPHMGITALIRNLATLTRNGIIAPLSDTTNFIINRLQNEELLRKGRVHPLTILSALRTYQSGVSARGSSTWTPVSSITDALDEAFYLSFGTLEPTGKKLFLGLDVSGSMTGPDIAGMPGITPRVATAALAMVAARVEKQFYAVAFSHKLVDFPVSKKERLDSVIERMDRMDFGGTDASLPIKRALDNKIEADAFLTYTDNETWAGRSHPVEVLQEYRAAINPEAKFIEVSMVPNSISIYGAYGKLLSAVYPNDGGLLDVVGFDTATPNIISEFVKGNI